MSRPADGEFGKPVAKLFGLPHGSGNSCRENWNNSEIENPALLEGPRRAGAFLDSVALELRRVSSFGSTIGMLEIGVATGLRIGLDPPGVIADFPDVDTSGHQIRYGFRNAREAGDHILRSIYFTSHHKPVSLPGTPWVKDPRVQ